MLHHGEVLRQVGNVEKAVVVQIGADWRESSLDAQDKAMLEFAEHLTFDHPTVGPVDLNKLREAGFSDENILDIIALVSYRNFSNRLHMSLGCSDPENLTKWDDDLAAMLEVRRSAAPRPTGAASVS